MIYFDNAATTGKKPQSVINTVSKSLREYAANPGRSGHAMSLKASMAVYSAREKIADFFGASGAENVVFTLNCTHSINYVLKGLLKAGDRVLISSVEHNAVMRPLIKLGVNFDVAKVSFNDDETFAEFERKLKSDTKLVICTGASNVFGKTLPIKRIGDLCRKNNVLFAVDAAQIAGVLPINMGEMNIDFLCVAPHKSLYAPMGIGVLICEKPIENTLIEGGTGTNSIEFVQPTSLPERLESGTVNLPGIMGVAAGIDHIKKIGQKRLYDYEINLCRHLYNGVSAFNWVELYTPVPTINQFVPVVSFNLKGIPSTVAAQKLSDAGIAVRGGLHCAPTAHKQLGTLETGTVRVSVSTFNNLQEVDYLISVVGSKKILKNM